MTTRRIESQMGTTTRQIAAAAPGALFVWCNNALSYPKAIAHALGRNDLVIIGLSELRHERLRGSDRELVIDHASVLSEEQLGVWEAYAARRGPRVAI